jgi:hypothetical protein
MNLQNQQHHLHLLIHPHFRLELQQRTILLLLLMMLLVYLPLLDSACLRWSQKQNLMVEAQMPMLEWRHLTMD